MRYSEGGRISGDFFPELTEARNKARQRHRLTRLIMIGASFAGGMFLAGLVYAIFTLVSFGAQFAASQAQAQMTNSVAIVR